MSDFDTCPKCGTPIYETQDFCKDCLLGTDKQDSPRNEAEVRERAEACAQSLEDLSTTSWAAHPEIKKRLAKHGRTVRDLLALLAEKDKVIGQVLQAFDGIEPEDWNDGCGCCAAQNLDRSDEWKALSEAALAAREQAEGGG